MQSNSIEFNLQYKAYALKNVTDTCSTFCASGDFEIRKAFSSSDSWLVLDGFRDVFGLVSTFVSKENKIKFLSLDC